MRLAHLSDLHFASWDWNLSQFLSKRWLGNLNFLFGRKNDFDHSLLNDLPSLLKALSVSTVIITGDLSTTSAPAEFSAAKRYIERLQDEGLEVLCIPGNHDHYTRDAYNRRYFYDYFPSCWSIGHLKEEGVTAKMLCPGWWVVGLDTALATSWFYSTGLFKPETERALENLLQTLPGDAQILLANHFPFFQHEAPRKHLVRGLELQRVIERHPQIKIYCHGHTHRKCIAPLQQSGLPLILDPGSTSHRRHGGWHLIDLDANSINVRHHEWDSGWKPSEAYELV